MLSNSSACQSCDSIWVVSGLNVRPRCSTKSRAIVGQSTPGEATTCAAYVPVAPLILPRNSARSTRASWRARRCTKTAISLPIVVGVAGCPWVWDRSGTSASSSAMSARVSMRVRAAGSHTSCTAPLTPSAYERLLMSSDVQQKWTSSERSPAPIWSRNSLIEYSTALTSWTVTASNVFSCSIVSRSKPAAHSRSWVFSSSSSSRVPRTAPDSARWMNHSTSTWMRSRLSAASERWSMRGAVSPR